MSLEIRAPEADGLARELAAATGEDIETAVVRAIEERLRGRRVGTPPAGTPRSKPSSTGWR